MDYIEAVPVCACGCGLPAQRDKSRGGYCKYAEGHRYNKLKAVKDEIAAAGGVKCACGCGGFVKHYYGATYRKYLKGHHVKGKKFKRSPEYCAYISERMKKQLTESHHFKGKTKETCAGLKRISETRKGELNASYGKFGEESGNWKGGKWRNDRGYIHIRVKDHPNASHGYVLQHALVMEEYLGRHIRKGEVIHHINGQKDDNSITNLWLCNGSKHRSAHESLFKLIKPLLDKGIVKFNRNKGAYELCA
jgi:hypothetical protein